MDECLKILQENENYGMERVDKVSFSLIKDFSFYINKDFDPQLVKDGIDGLLYLKNYFVYNSEYVDLFFRMLQIRGYYFTEEIKEAFFYLNHLKNPNNNSEVIKKFLCSPIIQDISFDGMDKFTIFSEEYGEFISRLASVVFHNNRKMRTYIERKKLPNRCHIHAYFMSYFLKEFYSITSLCASYFSPIRYYHSYTYNSEDNTIIDLCSNMVMDKEMFDRLFQPKEISFIMNIDVKDEIAIVDEKSNYREYPLLKIALYKQYLEKIGYTGTLEDGPVLKK